MHFDAINSNKCTDQCICLVYLLAVEVSKSSKVFLSVTQVCCLVHVTQVLLLKMLLCRQCCHFGFIKETLNVIKCTLNVIKFTLNVIKFIPRKPQIWG